MHPKSQYHFQAATESLDSLIAFTYPKVFRQAFTSPGFAVLDFGADYSPEKLRATMIALKNGLHARLMSERGIALHYQWLGRFDQQETTKFHRDNAAAQSFLMLGYEPTLVKSRLMLADYLLYAREQQLSEAEYFAFHNPMYVEGEQALVPYLTEVEGFDASTYRIVLFNNSRSTGAGDTLGLLHKAVMVTPDPTVSRFVNSAMLAFAAPGEVEGFSEEMQAAFVQSA
jgi:hypothetical protein